MKCISAIFVTAFLLPVPISRPHPRAIYLVGMAASSSVSALPNYALLPPRIRKEIELIENHRIPGISCAPRAENLRHFDVVIHGPADSPFQGGVFTLEMFLPEDFPSKPPKCRFMTKLYHPNVDALGRICLDILKEQWSPAIRLGGLCLSLQSLLASPNPEDPLDQNIATAWRKDERAAKATARQWTLMYATPK